MEPKHSKRMHSKQQDKKTAEYIRCAQREVKQSKAKPQMHTIAWHESNKHAYKNI